MKKLMLCVGLVAAIMCTMPAMADVVTVDQLSTSVKALNHNDFVLDQAGVIHEAAFAVSEGATLESHPALQVHVVFGHVQRSRISYIEPSTRSQWPERLNL